MVRSGDHDDAAAEHEHIRAVEADEANIRWLLAAVLHHQPEGADPDE
jgi:hypothetical protein